MTALPYDPASGLGVIIAPLDEDNPTADCYRCGGGVNASEAALQSAERFGLPIMDIICGQRYVKPEDDSCED